VCFFFFFDLVFFLVFGRGFTFSVCFDRMETLINHSQVSSVDLMISLSAL
jgi:hypothetical protein